MSFRLVKDPTDTEARYVPISGLAVVVGTMLELNTGATTWAVANASTEHWQKKAIATETVANTVTEVKAVRVNELQTWDVDLDNNSNADHNGDRNKLSATAGKVTNGSDSSSEKACFIQENAVGINTNKRAIGHFVGGTGVNPDATA